MPWIEKKIGLTLAESQKQAIGLALSSKALVITGGPGTGKTTIVNTILQILKAKDVSMQLCAPTGRAMQIENDYEKEVYNGDIGFVKATDADAQELCVNFEGRDVVYGSGELDNLVLAYATTIHKAQGSEYPAVVLPLSTQHYPMLQRNLLYTGLTRGKRLVVIVGQRKAAAIAVRNAAGRRRWTKLKDWLAA